MQTFVASRDVTIELEFIDGYDLVTPLSATYRIYNEDDNELKPDTELSVSGSNHSLVIAAAENVLPISEPSGYRRIEVSWLTPESKTIVSNFDYVIVEKMTLTAGVNSFAGSGRLMIASTELGNTQAIDEASFDEIQIAMAQAWRNISHVSVNITVNNVTYTSTSELDPASLAEMDSKDRRLLIEAQIIEADFLLGGNPVEQRRRMGLMSESIGEVSQFFRTAKPLALPVCLDAIRRLSKFIYNSRRIARG